MTKNEEYYLVQIKDKIFKIPFKTDKSIKFIKINGKWYETRRRNDND